MGAGIEIRDQHGLGRYIRERILPLGPSPDPVPFRGRVDGSAEALPFFDEMDASLRVASGAVWNVMGPVGSGKSLLARWAAARWGQRFLDDPEPSPAVIWISATRLRQALTDDRALTGGPFAFALSADVPGETPEGLARLLTKHPFIAIVDKDDDPHLAGWKLELPLGLPPTLRILHLAIRETLGGPCVRLELWDRETALLSAHRRRGAEGVKCIEALEASPAAALASYPPFVTWLLERENADAGAVARHGCFAEFLAGVHADFPGGIHKLEDWCEKLLDDPTSHASLRFAARRLCLEGAEAAGTRLGRTFRAFLVAEMLLCGKLDRILESRLLGEEDLELLGRLELDPAVCAGLLERSFTHPYETANAVNLHWRLTRTPLPAAFILRGLHGLRLSGHPFEEGLRGIHLEDSDLSGISAGKPRAEKCHFERCSLREAHLPGMRFDTVKLIDCSLELADLSASAFESCTLGALDLTQAILSGSTFERVVFASVVFGNTGEGEPLRLTECGLRSCDVKRMAAAGFFLKECKLRDINFEGARARSFHAEGSTFEKCDFMGFSAPNAGLEKTLFDTCILADVDFQGANLRNARLVKVEFQPGPTSRAGHTDTLTRGDPMHGSKSGFYAQDLSDGVYLDPELMRNADLRNADLRGVELKHTDLFRVDLRGARMDPGLRERARKMRAFLD